MRSASDEPLADQVRRFCEDLERDESCREWPVRQAELALRLYFVNFLQRTDWHRRPASAVVDEHGRTRHCQRSSKRFLAYLSERQGVPEPLVDSASVRDYLAHLAVHRSVSASTQNQTCAPSCSCVARCSA